MRDDIGFVGEEDQTFPAPVMGDEPASISKAEIVRELLFGDPARVSGVVFWTRSLFFVILFLWGVTFWFHSIDSNYAGRSILHLINLPFHEAGHIVFSPFGRLITSLGGTLGQMLVPLICLAGFLLQTRDPFAGSVALWWFGQNFFDIAPYIKDASIGVLLLLGGNTGRTAPYGFHDWQYILSETGLLSHDALLARLAHGSGIVIMAIAFVWGGYLLSRQYRIMGEN